MSARGQSTVVDVALALVVVSAAVGLLTVPSPAPTADGTADETIAALQTTTVTVTTEDGDRTLHGTPAQLLARATLDRVRFDGTAIGRTDSADRRTVERAVARVTRHRAARAQVIARWEPYPGASVAGRVAVGGTPPASATVDAAVTTLPAPLPLGAVPPTRAAAGYDALGSAAAESVVAAVAPPSLCRRARFDARARTRLVRRYRRLDRALGGRTVAPPAEAGRLASTDLTATRERLRRALAARFADDLRERFASPDRAARSMAAGEVQIVVRTWSP
ncbi:DUF7284 family protein [Halomarina pelagica]|uniref:DUF7284 family protein n=1 Tax=Halomarina pelagica TaxID=2961599 RepID=UPI0020C36D98|nr:hypothetical protein [Halomarina sp. BND7]